MAFPNGQHANPLKFMEKLSLQLIFAAALLLISSTAQAANPCNDIAAQCFTHLKHRICQLPGGRGKLCLGPASKSAAGSSTQGYQSPATLWLPQMELVRINNRSTVKGMQRLKDRITLPPGTYLLDLRYLGGARTLKTSSLWRVKVSIRPGHIYYAYRGVPPAGDGWALNDLGRHFVVPSDLYSNYDRQVHEAKTRGARIVRQLERDIDS